MPDHHPSIEIVVKRDPVLPGHQPPATPISHGSSAILTLGILRASRFSGSNQRNGNISTLSARCGSTKGANISF